MWLTTCPLILTDPASGFSKPAAIINVVVLPHPLGPKRKKFSIHHLKGDVFGHMGFAEPFILPNEFNFSHCYGTPPCAFSKWC
jgi:hypothetical protein